MVVHFLSSSFHLCFFYPSVACVLGYHIFFLFLSFTISLAFPLHPPSFPFPFPFTSLRPSFFAITESYIALQHFLFLARVISLRLLRSHDHYKHSLPSLLIRELPSLFLDFFLCSFKVSILSSQVRYLAALNSTVRPVYLF